MAADLFLAIILVINVVLLIVGLRILMIVEREVGETIARAKASREAVSKWPPTS